MHITIINESIYANYISMQNLTYSILLMGLGDEERPYFAVARMEDRHGRNLVPVAETKKHPNKYRTIEPPYKYTM
jgi:hypothetical protein